MSAAADATLLRQNIARFDTFMNGGAGESVALRDHTITTLLGLIGSTASGTAPPVTWPGRHWYDTSAEPAVLNVRDEDDANWIELPLGALAATADRPTRASIAAAEIPAPVQYLRTAGHTTPGDGGASLLKRVDAGATLSPAGVTDALGAKFELVVEHGRINIRQFGAAGVSAAVDAPAVQAALDFAALNVTGTYHHSGVEVGVPNSDAPYLMGSTTLFMKSAQVKLVGSGSGMPSARPCELYWSGANVTGIQVNHYNTLGTTTEGSPTTSADGSIIEGLTLTGARLGTVAAVTDRLKGHGIDARARLLIRNCTVQFFSGNGINIAASSGTGGATGGNANLWRIEGVASTNNGMSGLFVDGSDANAGYAIGLNVASNGRWGIWDSSFLGNSYAFAHVDANGLANKALNGAGESSFVTYGGNRYSAHPSASEAQLVGTTPGTDATVWVQTATGGTHTNIPLWVAAQPEGTYFHGGAIYNDNSNARSDFYGVYVESSQGGVAFGTTPVLALGGQLDNSGFTTGRSFQPISGGLLDGVGYSATGTNLNVLSFGGNDTIGQVLAMRYTGESFSFNLRRQSSDWAMVHANVTARTAFRITGENTTLQMGTGVAQPYLFQADTLAIGAGNNMRRRTTGSAAPTTGTFARGDIIWNVSPSAAGTVGWSCTTGGIAGSTAVFKTFGTIAA